VYYGDDLLYYRGDFVYYGDDFRQYRGDFVYYGDDFLHYRGVLGLQSVIPRKRSAVPKCRISGSRIVRA
jgi:hypothetical protein